MWQDILITTLEIAIPVVFTLGYYLGHRGLQGVIGDLKDIKNDVQTVKLKLEPAQVTQVNVPAA